MNNRMKKVMAHLKEGNYSSLVVSSPDAIFYLTGEHIHPGERLLALVLNSEGDATLILPTMFQVSDLDLNVKYFGDDDHPLVWLSELIDVNQPIGIDKNWPARFLLELMKILPTASFVNGSSAVDLARLCKDEDEKSLMRKASLINDLAMEKVKALIEEGDIDEISLKRKIPEIFSSLGAQGNSFEPIICFGKGAAEPHHNSDNTPLQEGSIIVDMGCVYEGYCSDMTRSFYYGSAPDKYIEAYQAVLAGNKAAIEMVKPGVKLADIDKAARRVIENAGLGEFFVHRTGHGIGIDVHEFPDVSASSEAICQPGMIFSVEPGVYIKDEFGIRIEDLVLVTDDGYEVLNVYNKELVIIPTK